MRHVQPGRWVQGRDERVNTLWRTRWLGMMLGPEATEFKARYRSSLSVPLHAWGGLCKPRLRARFPVTHGGQGRPKAPFRCSVVDSPGRSQPVDSAVAGALFALLPFCRPGRSLPPPQLPDVSSARAIASPHDFRELDFPLGAVSVTPRHLPPPHPCR